MSSFLSLSHLPSDPTGPSLLGSCLFSCPSGPGAISQYHASLNSCLTSSPSPGTVVVLSGGGAGHEPSHTGFVGKGMLAGAISGQVFASPSPTQILGAMKAVVALQEHNQTLHKQQQHYLAHNQPQNELEQSKEGDQAHKQDNHAQKFDHPAQKLDSQAHKQVLLVVKNYTGDRLNFGIAAERAKALGYQVSMVVVGDDAALPKNRKSAGRRGLAGTLFVHKTAGALADLGCPLHEVAHVAQWVADHVVTVGVAKVPKEDKNDTGKLEVELGLGIHGEAGFTTLPVTVASPGQMVGHMLDILLCQEDEERRYLEPAPVKGDDLVVLVNNLGGLSCLEMGVLAEEAVRQLLERGFAVRRGFVGTLMTSRNMAGFSISLLHLRGQPRDLVPLLDYPVLAPAWPATCFKGDQHSLADFQVHAALSLALGQPPHTTKEGAPGLFGRCLTQAMEALISHEAYLTECDAKVGDGDCGLTLRAGAQAILAGASSLSPTSPKAALSRLSDIVQESMGGSSGALYCLFLEVAAGSFGAKTFSESQLEDWATALRLATQKLSEYGKAVKGDRTMLDALIPASEALALGGGGEPLAVILARVKTAAEQGAAATLGMQARAGRSSYIAESRLTAPDPGATAVSLWIGAAVHAFLASNPA